jgi:hypothetical protein
MVVAAPKMHSAKMRGRCIPGQRIQLYLWRKSSRRQEGVLLSSIGESAKLPEAERDATDSDRDGDKGENPISCKHARNIALGINRAKGWAPRTCSVFCAFGIPKPEESDEPEYVRAEDDECKQARNGADVMKPGPLLEEHFSLWRLCRPRFV